ncbi:MAG: HEAT repeat domain-containing protein [Candidatus Thorarchaeota archaeon]|nr:MAG: HEAT repeat domain-containing protein [Candidatus Thorarchaeota archaeon]
MSRKTDRNLSRAMGGGDSLRRLKKAVKQVAKSSDDKITIMLEQITSIQATKDASLTGDEDTKLLAVCKLGEWGEDGFEYLDIALNDDNPHIRTVAAGMLAYTRRLDAIQILKKYSGDNTESVRETVAYAIGWLQMYGENIPEGPYIPVSRENPTEILLESDTIPLRTSDTVVVINDYFTSPESIEYGITIKNEGSTPIHEVSVSILSYPSECLSPADSHTQSISEIDANDSGSLIFGFKIEDEFVEGEIITSVRFVDSNGDDLAAKAGNVFVRSIYNQFAPLEMRADEFIHLKSDMRQWNREHTVIAEANEIFGALHHILEGKNLYIFQKEDIERDNVFMGVIAGISKSLFSENNLAVTLTVVGTKGDKISKLRIDIFSDNNEIVHSAASDIYETILKDLDIVDMNGEQLLG